jgi:Ala-tRNA(Pro) deacylase
MNLYNRIINLLTNNNIAYLEIKHAPVRTSKEAAEVRGCSEEEGAKSLVFIADDSHINLVLEGNKLVDKEKIKQALNLKKFKMASSEDVLKIVGCEVGGVPPFGNIFNKPIKVYLSEGFLKNKDMEFNAGDRTISIRMETQDFIKIVNPIILDYAV